MVGRGIRLAGLVVANTAASWPADAGAPGVLSAVLAPGVRSLVTSRSDAFLRTTLALPRPALPAAVKAAYRSPYGTVGERAGIDAFVADVPVGSGHPSRAALDEVTQGVGRLAEAGVPTLVAWGPRDPVFGEWFLRDWRARVPHADVHRFAQASHLVPEDPAFADVVLRWLDERVLHPTTSTPEGSQAASAPGPRACGRRWVSAGPTRRSPGRPRWWRCPPGAAAGPPRGPRPGPPRGPSWTAARASSRPGSCCRE